MQKNYLDQLDMWARQHPSARRDKNRVAFLAVRHDVQAALAAGFAIKTVWTNLHQSQRVNFGYDTFLKYVKRFIYATPNASAKTPKPVQPATAPNVERGDQSAIPRRRQKMAAARPPPTQTGFIFDAVPNQEDLL